MLKKPLLIALNKNYGRSALIKLFFTLLFQDPSNQFYKRDKESGWKYFILNESFQNLVFHNGSVDSDDQMYLYETIREYESEISYQEIESVIFQFLDSENAISLIYDNCEDNPENYDEVGFLKDIDDEMFNRTRGGMLQGYLQTAALGTFHDDVKAWLKNLCIRISLDVFSGVDIDDEKLESLLELFLDNAGLKNLAGNCVILEDNRGTIGTTKPKYGRQVF